MGLGLFTDLGFLFSLLAGFLDFLLFVLPGQYSNHGVLHVGSEDEDQVGGHPHVNSLETERGTCIIQSLKVADTRMVSPWKQERYSLDVRGQFRNQGCCNRDGPSF